MRHNIQMKHILIIEDDPIIAETIAYALEQNTFQVTCKSTGQEGLDCFIKSLGNNPIDLVLLDIGLPDINGFDVLKQIRQISQIPVIFTTARGEEIDKVLGLELGADDYVTKPLSTRELVARINANLKHIAAVVIPPKTNSIFQIDEQLMQITFEGNVLILTKAEYNLLAYFINKPKQIFSRDQLLTAVWNDSYIADERTIDTHIKSLRSKLSGINKNQDYISTHRGLGYSFKL
jgi:two-component system, OmpR family, catabolic regulation response regulator CreB